MKVRDSSESRGSKAQMSIDFLIGISVFVTIAFFAFQFVSASVSPYQLSSQEKIVTSHKIADSLVYDQDKLGTGEPGQLNLSYLNNNDVDAVRDDLGLEPRYFMNLTVEHVNESEYYQDMTFGPDSPTGGVSVTRAARTGVDVRTGDKVVIKVRVW